MENFPSIEILSYHLAEQKNNFIITIEPKINDALDIDAERGGGKSFFKVVIEKSNDLPIKESKMYRSR